MADRRVVAGRYQMGDLIGEGGMGAVYRGVDSQTGDSVALKLLKSDLVARDPQMVERFAREGEALRLLNHPNIVKMLAALQEDDQHYIIMEYVSGGSLYDLLHRGDHRDSRLDTEHILKIALELADALTRAHHLNIIHRDLKPANVLLADDGTPRLSDFGIAYMQARARVTETDSVVGTLSYLSPEALQGDSIDARTDIWAFGVMLFELLAGSHPFDRVSVPQTMLAIISDPPADLESLRPDVPIALVDLIYRMLEKDRNQRISSVRQIGAALEAILRGLDYDSSRVGTRHAVSTASYTGAFDTPTPAPDAMKHNLPKQPTPFVGREPELAELAKLLRDPQVHLVSIVAPGGMGKTRLALEIAQLGIEGKGDLVGRPYENGIFLVQLAPLTSPEHIVPTIADAVGFQFYPGGEPKQQLLDYFREKAMLLVIDNFEHLLDGAGLVSDILQAAPQVKIIATSRERLNLRGETIFTIGGMDFPDWETPEDALQYSAVKLFMQSAKRVRPDFELGADDLKYVARICRLVYGMPLGIELAASWLEMLPLDEIADEIGRSLDFLESELRDLPERHRSLRAVFEYSWNLLADEERATFARVAVFRGGFSRQAAQTVTSAALKQLMALVNKSLLKRDPNSGVYQVHELLRQYADERLEQSGESDQIHDAHSDYYLNALHTRQRELEGGRQVEALKEIESDIENVRAAWLFAAKNGRYERLDKAAQSLWVYYAFRNQHAEGEAIFEQAATHLGVMPPSPKRDGILGQIMVRQAEFSRQLDHRGKTERLMEESGILLQRYGTLRSQAFWANTQGHIHTYWKEAIDARPFYAQALALFREAGDRVGEAWSLGFLGNAYWFRVSPKETNLLTVSKCLQDALVIQEDTGDFFGMAFTLMNLGNLAGMEKKFEESKRLYDKSLELSRQIGDSLITSTALMNIGVTIAMRSQFQQARQFYHESLTIRREQGHIGAVLESLNNLAWLAYDEGLFAESRNYRKEMLALTEGTEQENWFVANLLDLAQTLWAQGEYAEAASHLRRALARNEKSGNREELLRDVVLLGRLALAQGHDDEARQHLERGLRLVQDLDRPDFTALVRQQMGLLAYQQGDYDQASEHLTAALAYFQSDEVLAEAIFEWWMKEPTAISMVGLGDVARAEGDYDSARHRILEALALVWPGRITVVLAVLPSMADLLVVTSQIEPAVELFALVQQHPKAYAVDKTRAGKLLDSLKSQLAPDVFDTAVDRGQSLDLEAVVSDLLAENSR